MNLEHSVAKLQKEHVLMELECIDRMYLNAYVPKLTSEAGVAGFVRGYLGHRFASTKAVAQMTESFVESIMEFALEYQIDLVRFQKGASRRGGLYRRSPGEGACAPNGAQKLRRWRQHSLDQLQQRPCELLLFLLFG